MSARKNPTQTQTHAFYKLVRNGEVVADGLKFSQSEFVKGIFPDLLIRFSYHGTATTQKLEARFAIVDRTPAGTQVISENLSYRQAVAAVKKFQSAVIKFVCMAPVSMGVQS